MRQIIIIVLMLVTIGGALAAFVGNTGGCLVSIIAGLLFAVLAARNGRKQQEEWHKR